MEQSSLHWLSSWCPLLLSAGLVADTFAGERERDTLEALLASRLSDRAILFGKTAAVAAYGWAITLVCWIAGWLAAGLSQGAPAFALPPVILLSFPVLSLLAAWYVACVGVLISLHAQSVRQAQQWMSMVMLCTLLVVAGFYAASLFETTGSPQASSQLLSAGVTLMALDLGLLLLLLLRPQRKEWLIH
jgi:ABC-2 type transport system permease protein